MPIVDGSLPGSAPDAAVAFTSQGSLAVDAKGYFYDPRFRALLERSRRLDPALLLGTEALKAMLAATKLLNQRAEEVMARHGITHPNFRAMLCIRDYGPEGVQQHQVASWLGVSPRHVTGMVDALVAQGLAERLPDPADRRAVNVRLTAAGESLAQEGWKHLKVMQKGVLECLTTEERLQLRHLSLKLVQAASASAGSREIG